MSKFFMSSLLCFFAGSAAHAAGGSMFGFNVGTGLPFVTQAGLNYVSSSGKFGVDLGYNIISVDSGLAKVSLTKPEVNVKWHPFAGAFFLGVGIGQQTLVVEATESTTSQSVKATVTAMTVTPNVGWMWGVSGGGLFFGIDFGMQSPSGAKTEVDAGAVPTTSQEYLDVVDAGNKFGESSMTTMTLLRLGYLF